MGTTSQTVSINVPRLVRLAAIWLAIVLFHFLPLGSSASPAALTLGFFAAVLSLIVVASLGVLNEATTLARRWGEPYGSLVLTLSVVIIEVVLIAVVMLGPTPVPTIARDSVFSVMMIILNLVVGLAIVVATRRWGPTSCRRSGTIAYLVLIAAFGLVTFVVPRLFHPPGALPIPVAIPVAGLIAATYAVFVYLQMGPWRERFTEPSTVNPARSKREGSERVDPRVLASKRARFDSTPSRLAILVLLLLAISLLAEHLGVLIDYGIQVTDMPPALGGVIIAAIVFMPETLTTLRAARANQVQRVANLCLGAFVSTVGLTIPSVLILGAMRGRTVDLFLDPVELLLFALTLVAIGLTFTRPRIRPYNGWVHLGLFAVFVVSLFSV